MAKSSVSHSESTTAELSFDWTVEDLPAPWPFEKIDSLNRRSPVFEALSKYWTIEMTQNYIDKTGLYFTLNLVDKNGHPVQNAEKASIENNPIFNTKEMTMKVVLIDPNSDSPLSTRTLASNRPLKEMLGVSKRLSDISLPYFQQKTMHGGGYSKSIRIRFEICVMLKKTEKRYKNRLEMMADCSHYGKKLFEEGKFSDFSIRTIDGGEIRAHRAILSATSSYFKEYLDLYEDGEIAVPERFPVMNELVRFLYTGKLSENLKTLGFMEVYIAADTYKINDFKVKFKAFCVLSSLIFGQ